ncbi:hypothetical protein B0T26DRAFT_688810 [Lasiosphaeria miniovina]|uniref:Uncharacterized protein n=1 Tax=Lasiosphaeria miniovina TaxID=1954250 RepID=A0AA40BHX4_9PEZI|nr:uncharacterized protein B0T26DRAFT_688810 [Lasiosphaeria miniovina]KAK0734515.1 hypothetical protein B0T26DRAFT_688810 [Lasiosphaeria miniovina]
MLPRRVSSLPLPTPNQLSIRQPRSKSTVRSRNPEPVLDRRKARAVARSLRPAGHRTAPRSRLEDISDRAT